MKLSKIMIPITLIILIISITSCFPNEVTADKADPSGFFMGIWHGWIAPISLILSFFNPSIRIYDAVNTGWAYDLGFYIAIISGFGSISIFRKRHKKD